MAGKTLILSCNTGQGHNAAGKAVAEELARRGGDVELRDSLAFSGERVSRGASGLYINVSTYAPDVFGTCYSIAKKISSRDRKFIVYYMNSRCRGNLLEYIRAEKITTVVCPHLFPAQTMTSLRSAGLLPRGVRFAAVATDYACIPFWEECDPDAFFIPHRDTLREFTDAGIPESEIIASGIPVSNKFRGKLGKTEARAALGLPESGRIALVMTGSMGYGDMGETVEGLRSRLPGITVAVLAGNNERRKAWLRKHYGGDGRVRVIDFTDKVNVYMDACDVLFTKPGGLTSTEAAVKRVPLVHTAPIPGCETKNALFFASHGMSINSRGMKRDELYDVAVALMESDDARRHMTERQSEEINPRAAELIADWVEGK